MIIIGMDRPACMYNVLTGIFAHFFAHKSILPASYNVHHKAANNNVQNYRRTAVHCMIKSWEEAADIADDL